MDALNPFAVIKEQSKTSFIVICLVVLVLVIFLLSWKTPAFSMFGGGTTSSTKQPNYSRKIDDLMKEQDKILSEQTQAAQAAAQEAPAPGLTDVVIEQPM